MYQQPVKMTKKKKIELIVLICIAIWFIIFGINYIRYTQAKNPWFALKLTHKYDDGTTVEWCSLGYCYRVYNRNSISRTEFVPFWILMENPEARPDLPVVPENYNVPENTRKLDKFRGLLYYYTIKGELIGTYKCINSTNDCNKAVGGTDKYDTLNKDPMTAQKNPRTLGHIYDSLAFVNDSTTQEAGNKTIYLYKFNEEKGNKPEILAKFGDVKESTYDENKNIGYGENYRYIVKDINTNKWGVIFIYESGKYDTVIPFEYDSISYDADTKYYILGKENKWKVYDLYNSKDKSKEIETPIYDVWMNNNRTYYIKTGTERTVGADSFIDYKIYRMDDFSRILLSGDRITQVLQRSTFIMYITANDNVLHFMDYGGDEKYRIQLNFSRMDYDDLTHPAFSIYNESDGFMVLRIYETRKLSYDYESKTVNIKRWDLNT